MKLKKVFFGCIIVLGLIGLTACGTDSRKEFTKAMYSTNSKEFDSAKFDMNIKEFDMKTNDSAGSAYINIIANQIKDIKIDGNYASDQKQESYKMEMNLNLLGQKIPFHLVGQKDKAYLSTNFVTSLLELAKGFQLPIDVSAEDLKKLDGKYMDVETTSESLTTGNKKESTNPFKNINPTSANNSKMITEVKKKIESFDKDSFKKDGDKITHTFTKKEILELLDTMKTVAKEEKDTDNEKEINNAIDSLKKTYDKLDIKITANKKTSKTDYEIAVVAATDSKKDKFSMTVAGSIQPEKKDQKINLPDKKDILSQDQVTEILNGITSSQADSTDLDDEDIDKQLDEMIAQIEANPEMVTDDIAKSIRTSGESYLSAAQMKRLNAALDKALASNAS